MRHRAQLVFVALFALALAACASGAAGTKSSTDRPSRNVILEDEIAEVQASNAYELIRRLRPHFLQVSGPSTIRGATEDIVVYLDGVLYGGLASLRNLSAQGIIRIERLSGSQATTRFGTGHTLGAILITTRVGGR